MRLIDADKLRSELITSNSWHANNPREESILARTVWILDAQPTIYPYSNHQGSDSNEID